MAGERKPTQIDSVVPRYGDGIPGIAREKIDGAVESTTTAMKDFGWEASTMGIGQGVMAAALLTMGAYMLPEAIDGAGLEAGFNHGVRALFTNPFTWTTMALGGAFGAILDVRNDQTNLEKDVANARSNLQTLQKDHSVTKENVKTLEEKVQVVHGFVEQEKMRRESATLASKEPVCAGKGAL